MRIRSVTPYLVLTATPILYFAFLTRTYYWDGVLFALNIEQVHRGETPFSILFHPNHLLYSVFGYALYDAAHAIDKNLRAITVLQICNVVISVVASFFLFRLANRITRSASIALFAYLLFAFGATWWKFSTDADSYILAVLFLILAISFVLESPVWMIQAGLCHTLAMLFHELAIFTYFPVLAAIALDSARSKRNRFWASLVYCSSTGACVAATYLICYSYTDRGTYPSLFAWMTSYASDSGFTHSLAQITGAYLSSYVKLFVGGKLSLIRDYFSIAIFLSLAICFAMLVYALLLYRRTRAPAAAHPNTSEIFILWAWFIPAAVFLACWDPGSAFHKLFVWPSIVLLIAAYLARSGRLQSNAHSFTALALAIAAWNFSAFIYPHSRLTADPVLVLARALDRELPQHAIVYFRVLDPDDWYLEYFAPGRTWSPLPQNTRSVVPNLQFSTAGPVCFETTALEQLEKGSSQPPGLSTHIDPKRRWDLVNSRHNIRLECLK